LKKVFITGATGYIGNAFLKKYSGKYHFKAYGRRKPIQTVEYCKGDINNLPELINACSGMDVIIHAAALTPDKPEVLDAEYIKTNIFGTHNVLKAAVRNNIKKVIFVSSVCAVGIRNHSLPVREDDACEPTDGMYGFSKMAGERLCKYYAEKHDLRVLVMRPATVVPQHNFVAPGIGSIPWLSYVHIEDVLQELYLLLEDKKIKFGIFHAAPDNRFSRFDISKARTLLGYKPKHNFNKETRPDLIALAKIIIKKLLAGVKK